MHFMILFALFGACLIVAPVVFWFCYTVIRLLGYALWPIVKWVPTIAILLFIVYIAVELGSS